MVNGCRGWCESPHPTQPLLTPIMIISDPLHCTEWPWADLFWATSPECNCPPQWSGALSRPRPGLSTRGLLPHHCDQEKRATGTQRRPCLPLTLSYQTPWPPRVTPNLPEKLTLTQYSPNLLGMTAELTAAICFEVSSQVLPLSVWVERRAAQVHNSAAVCACRCSRTWQREGGFMCTFILVHVGRGEGAEFAFFLFRASVYIILLCGPSCSASLMWEKPRQASFRATTKHTTQWNSFSP